MQEVICKKVDKNYLCLIDKKIYRFKKIALNGELTDKPEIRIEGEIFVKDGLLVINGKENEEQFIREYYRKKIPSSEEMNKMKEIWRNAKTPKEKQSIYIKALGGRPENAICILDKLPKEEFIGSGFKPKEHEGEIYEFIKKEGNRSIVMIVSPEDRDYRVSLIRIYDKNNLETPICVTYNGKPIGFKGD